MTKRYDIIFFGATSFVGKILAEHFQALQVPDVKWAIAGRSEKKLVSLKEDLGLSSVPHIVVDAADETALREMAQSTQTIVSTVGPYALYGEPLVKVCCEEGVNYCDLTGEPQWIHQMLEKYEETAKQNRAKIVHCCGFDSIPSDLGVLYLQTEANKRKGAFCQRVDLRVKGAGGGMSGGTLASIFNVAKELRKNPSIRKVLANPFSLSGSGEGLARQKDINKTEFDSGAGYWLAPFIMAGINTKIVHRSHRLAALPYGKSFLYSEAMMMGKGPAGMLKSAGLTTALGGFMAAGFFDLTRKALQRFLPNPGEGPSPEEQEKGFFDIRIYGYLKDQKTPAIVTKVTGDRDPGYGSTAKMLAQAALCLTFDPHVTEKEGGFWTPATLLGLPLVERLRKHAGLNFEVLKS